MYNQDKGREDSLLKEAERVLEHAERNLPTDLEIEKGDGEVFIPRQGRHKKIRR